MNIIRQVTTTVLYYLVFSIIKYLSGFEISVLFGMATIATLIMTEK